MSCGALQAVKTVHTMVWAFFAACILAIPIAALRGSLGVAVLLASLVALEVIVLLANGLHCPLTAVAARFTDDRKPNFDIYLPVWLARYNKVIFGSLFGIGLLTILARWLAGPR